MEKVLLEKAKKLIESGQEAGRIESETYQGLKELELSLETGSPMTVLGSQAALAIAIMLKGGLI